MSGSNQAHHPITEQPGPMTADSLAAESLAAESLAAESLAANGSFASGAATASSVPSHASTVSNTDTSGATILPPASDGPARSEPTQDYLPTHTTMGTGMSTGTGISSADGAYDTTKGGPQAADGGAAPGYIASVTREGMGPGQLKPKGLNLTEGGFDSDAPNASFETEIGSRGDPGLRAEDGFAKRNARSGADAGYPGGIEEDAGGRGGFEVLGDEAA